MNNYLFTAVLDMWSSQQYGLEAWFGLRSERQTHAQNDVHKVHRTSLPVPPPPPPPKKKERLIPNYTGLESIIITNSFHIALSSALERQTRAQNDVHKVHRASLPVQKKRLVPNYIGLESIVITDSFHIALSSALEQTHCGHITCDFE